MMMMIDMFCCFLTEVNVARNGPTSSLTATGIVENADVTFADT
jgi:hypothetical protein